MSKYMNSDKQLQSVASNLYANPGAYATSQSELTIEDRIKTVKLLKPILENFFFIVILFMVFLAVILNSSLIQGVSKFTLLTSIGHVRATV